MKAPRSDLWTFLSVIILAFCRSCAGSLMSLGLPNYILFDRNESAATAALTGTIFAISYAVVSLYIQKWSDKIGKLPSLKIAIWINALISVLYLLPYNLPVLYFIRVIDGGSCGWLWTLLEANLSDLGSRQMSLDRKIAHYNFAWNVGGIMGYLIGAVVVYYIVNNAIVFQLNVWISLPMIVSVWLIKRERKTELFIENNQNHLDEPIQNMEKKGLLDESVNSGKEKMHFEKFSIIIPMLLVSIFSAAYGTLPILISAKLEYFTIAAYNTYVFAFVRSITSTFASRVFDRIAQTKMMRLVLWSGVILAGISFIFGVTLNIWVFILLNAIFGITSMFIYAMGLKIILEHNRAKRTVKYSSWFQFFNGIISGILPYLAGLGAAYSIDAMFWACGIFGLLMVGTVQGILFKYTKKTQP